MTINRIANRVPKIITVAERIRLARLDYAFVLAVRNAWGWQEHDPNFQQLNNIATRASNSLLAAKIPYDQWDAVQDENCQGK